MKSLGVALSPALKGLLGLAILVVSLVVDAADELPNLIARIKPSVLAVGFYQETQNPRFAFRGSGFIVASGNLLVTNAHVIARSEEIDRESVLVVHSRGSAGQAGIRRAVVIHLDKAHDLALLRFDGSPLPAVDLGKPDSIREGQLVAFMGFPLGSALGLTPVTHRGSVSAITSVALPSPTARQLDARAINRIKEGAFEFIQLDATAYPGNSGGPLFDLDTGTVVGVVNMVALKGTRESALTHPSGISYAIPVEFVLQMMAAAR
ncbi:MAG: serine protease [Burkholderiaceae bacterium]|nr:serine protease [Burkholderiaceae bacterium]